MRGPNTNPVKKHLTFTIRDFYGDYTKACKKDKKEPRPYKKYRDFIYSVFAEIFHMIVYEAWHFVMPYSLGEFYIREKTRQCGRPFIDWKRTRKIGKKIYTFNEHTFKKVFKFTWDKKYANFINSKFYKFELIDGKEKLHKQYNVGRLAIANYYFDVGKNKAVLIKPYNKAVRVLEEPKNEYQKQ